MSDARLNTSEFQGAFELEQERSLRKRFMLYCAVVIGLILFWRGLDSLLNFGLRELGPAFATASDRVTVVIVWIAAIIRVSIYALALWYSSRHLLARATLIKMAFGLVLVSGAMATAADVAHVLVTRDPTMIFRGSTAVQIGINGAIAVLIVHFFACLFLPFKPIEAIRAAVPLVVLNALVTIIFGFRTPLTTGLTLALIPAVAFPGIAICWWRYSKFRQDFAISQITGRYSELRRELVDARRLHEALFPPKVAEGPLSFTYVYEPMRQIGGDYLFARFEPDAKHARRMHLLLIDVTGHGIAAALTVNRLYGEIERLFAENPDTGPGDVLSALNRYVHLTLSRHSIYATALCIRIDSDRDTLEYASGGHPPAFLATADARIERLDSTSFVLGACHPDDFDPGVQTVSFMQGDTLFAYTDGAMEARNREGRMFGLAGLERTLASCTIQGGHLHGYCRSVVEAVGRHRAGQADDDTLVVEVRRAVSVNPRLRPVSELATTGAPAR